MGEARLWAVRNDPPGPVTSWAATLSLSFVTTLNLPRIQTSDMGAVNLDTMKSSKLAEASTWRGQYILAMFLHPERCCVRARCLR